MKIPHFAFAAVLSLGSAFVAVEPAAAMPRAAAPSPVVAADKIEIVPGRHRHNRHYRRHHRCHRDWRAERRWREHRHRQYHHRYYRPHRNGDLRLHFRAQGPGVQA